jgi:hypothetical protein
MRYGPKIGSAKWDRLQRVRNIYKFSKSTLAGLSDSNRNLIRD